MMHDQQALRKLLIALLFDATQVHARFHSLVLVGGLDSSVYRARTREARAQGQVASDNTLCAYGVRSRFQCRLVHIW